MSHQHRRTLLWIALGVVLGLAIITVLDALFIRDSGRSGCPVEHNLSTEDAQVFLMGTIGGDYTDPNRDCWREYVIQPVLEDLGVTYFNPVVSDWTDENAAIEARVIAQAETIVLVITENHPSIGSLAESGWAVLSALERDQTMIVYIAPNSADTDSHRARQIVLSQAVSLAQSFDRVTLVDNLAAIERALRDHYAP